MTTLSTMNMVSTGILQPKLLHRFLVSYRGTSNTGDVGDDAEIARLLSGASMNTVSVKLPQLQLSTSMGGLADSRRYRYNGLLEVVIEEDISNVVAGFVQALGERAIGWLAVTLIETDGNDAVLAAYDFRNATALHAQSAEHSYYSRHATISGTLTDVEVDTHGKSLMTANLRASVDNGRLNTVSQTITFTNDMVAVYRYSSNHPTVTDFLKGLN